MRSVWTIVLLCVVALSGVASAAPVTSAVPTTAVAPAKSFCLPMPRFWVDDGHHQSPKGPTPVCFGGGVPIAATSHVPSAIWIPGAPLCCGRDARVPLSLADIPTIGVFLNASERSKLGDGTGTLAHIVVGDAYRDAVYLTQWISAGPHSEVEYVAYKDVNDVARFSGAITYDTATRGISIAYSDARGAHRYAVDANGNAAYVDRIVIPSVGCVGAESQPRFCFGASPRVAGGSLGLIPWLPGRPFCCGGDSSIDSDFTLATLHVTTIAYGVSVAQNIVLDGATTLSNGTSPAEVPSNVGGELSNWDEPNGLYLLPWKHNGTKSTREYLLFRLPNVAGDIVAKADYDFASRRANVSSFEYAWPGLNLSWRAGTSSFTVVPSGRSVAILRAAPRAVESDACALSYEKQWQTLGRYRYADRKLDQAWYDDGMYRSELFALAYVRMDLSTGTAKDRARPEYARALREIDDASELVDALVGNETREAIRRTDVCTPSSVELRISSGFFKLGLAYMLLDSEQFHSWDWFAAHNGTRSPGKSSRARALAHLATAYFALRQLPEFTFLPAEGRQRPARP